MRRAALVSVCLALAGCHNSSVTGPPGSPTPIEEHDRTLPVTSDDVPPSHRMDTGVFPTTSTLQKAAIAAYPYGEQTEGKWKLDSLASAWEACGRSRALSFFIDRAGMPRLFVLSESGSGNWEVNYNFVVVADCSDGSVVAIFDSQMDTPKIVHLETRGVASKILDTNSDIWKCQGDASVPAMDGFVQYVTVFREGKSHTTCQYHAPFPPSTIKSYGGEVGEKEDPDSYAAYYAAYMSRMASFVEISNAIKRILADSGVTKPEQSQVEAAVETQSQEVR